jgi:hypothetical protein
MNRTLKIAGAAGVLLLLTGCIAGSAASHHAADSGILIQFLLGLWHGVIAPVTLIVEVINKVAPHLIPWPMKLYESAGTGAAYDVGFYLGLAGGPPIVFRTWPRRTRVVTTA